MRPEGGPQLKHTTEKLDEDTVIVRVTGEVDAYNEAEFRAAFGEIGPGGVRFIVADLTGVPFIDSKGLGVLNGVRRRAEEASGKLVVICEAGHVRRTFEQAGFPQIIPLHETEDAALEDVRQAKGGGGDG
ncbi:MAG: STAS domain-containing protein [Armatimonadota bacterium]|jgi:stage II sporulation protein AA (anti-sigma F factor antagonist)